MNDNSIQPKKKSSGAPWKRILAVICAVIVALVLVIVVVRVGLMIKNRNLESFEAGGWYLDSTIKDGDILLVDKAYYDKKDVERFDIVAFSLPGDDASDTPHFKRVTGMPGETVEITSEGRVLINGQKPKFYYDWEIRDQGDSVGPVKIGTDEFFVLGWQGPDSRSQEVGNVSINNIIGKVVKINGNTITEYHKLFDYEE